MTDKPLHYCPGCTHGIIHRLIAEVMCEMDILGTTIGVSPVGCTYNNYEYFACDMVQAAHGRAPAVATGIKRVHPDQMVFTYQGDGDLAAIGTAEIVHAAARGEKICTFFVNNADLRHDIRPDGADHPARPGDDDFAFRPRCRTAGLSDQCQRNAGHPAAAPSTSNAWRSTTSSNITQAKKAIRKAFRVQQAGLGFAMVEILSTCPTNWGKDPVASLRWVEDAMFKQYPLGVFRGQDLEVAP